MIQREADSHIGLYIKCLLKVKSQIRITKFLNHSKSFFFFLFQVLTNFFVFLPFVSKTA